MVEIAKGEGGVLTFGKNSQIIPYFLFEGFPMSPIMLPVLWRVCMGKRLAPIWWGNSCRVRMHVCVQCSR